MKNILTVDFEGWLDTCTVQKYLPKCTGNIPYDDRIPESASALLGVLNHYGLKATFFVLGSVAEKHPELIRKISGLGHRLGSHGYKHKKAYLLTEEEFDSDVKKSLDILSSLTSAPIESFRAPNWSIDETCVRALKILCKYGFKYDASFPHSCDGDVLSHRPHNIITEIPRSTVKILGWEIPFAGGAFLRAYPIGITEMLIRRANARGIPVVLYVHPWELDCHAPKIPMGWIDEKIQYLGINGMAKKLESIFERFEFVPLEEFFESDGKNKK